MRLVSAVLGFVLRKAGVFAALVLTLFVILLLLQTVVPPLRQAVTDRERLPQVTAERVALEAELAQLKQRAAAVQIEKVDSLRAQVSAEIEAGHRAVADKRTELERLRTQEVDVCGIWDWGTDAVSPGTPCKDAQDLVNAAEAALSTAEGTLRQAQADSAVLLDSTLTTQDKLDRLGQGGQDPVVERAITNAESDLRAKKTEEESLKQQQASAYGHVIDLWARSWKWLVTIVALVLVLPPVLRTVSYFVLMPIVHRAHTPIHLAAGRDSEGAGIRSAEAERTLRVQLRVGDVLCVRDDHLRPAQGDVRSRLLYDWASPFISFAAGCTTSAG